MTSDSCNRISLWSLPKSEHLCYAYPLGRLAALYGTCEGIGGIIMGVGSHAKVALKVAGELREAFFPV